MRSALIYGHPWSVDLLGQCPFADVDLWIEVAEQTVVGHRLGEPSGPGCESRLRGNGPTPSVISGARLVAASAVPVALEAVIGGAILYEDCGFLVHAAHVHRCRDLLAHCERIALWWDLADPPGAAFDGLADALQRDMGRGTWKGVHLYVHPDRAAYDVEDRRRQWAMWLEQPELVAS